MNETPTLDDQPEILRFLTRISGKLIYGAIIVEAVIGSLDDPLPRNLVVIVTVWLSLHAVTLAGAFTQTISEDMERRRTMSWGERLLRLFKPTWVMGSAVVPFTFFGLAAIGIISQPTALRLTKAALFILLAFFGFVARRQGGSGMLTSILAGLLVALLGFAVIQIKLWIKYVPEIGY